MKRIILSVLVAACASAMFAKDMQQLVVTTTPPMHCQNCENKIKKGELRFVKGIKKIETNIPDQRVTIDYDADITNPEQIENAFHKIGYDVEVIKPETTDCNNATGCCKEQGKAASNCAGNCCQ